MSLDTGSPSKPTKLSSVQWPRVRGNQVVRDEFNRPEWAEVKQKLEALDQADLSQLVASKEEHMMRKILDVFRLLLCANSRMTCSLLCCGATHGALARSFPGVVPCKYRVPVVGHLLDVCRARIRAKELECDRSNSKVCVTSR